MTSFIAKVRERRAEITAQIAALVAERDELDAVDRVYVRLSGDGADIAGDEPADHFPDAGKMVAANNSPEASGTAREAPGGSAPSDGIADLSQPVEDQLRDGGPVAGSADLRAAQDGAQHAPRSNLQHDAGDRADPDPHSLVGSSNSPEGAFEEVGGFPVAATPHNVEQPGDTKATREANPGTSSASSDVTAGETATFSHATGKSAGGAGASPAAPSLRQRIEDLHKAHPEYTARQAIEALGCKQSSLTDYSAMLGIKWTRERAAAAEPAQPDPEPEAPEPTPEPERPPSATPEPANDIASADRPMRPSGRQYWLVNGAGEYLNRYCLGFTRDRREAWSGSAMQLVACRRKFEIARDLSDKPVEKEQAAPINREVA